LIFTKLGSLNKKIAPREELSFHWQWEDKRFFTGLTGTWNTLPLSPVFQPPGNIWHHFSFVHKLMTQWKEAQNRSGQNGYRFNNQKTSKPHMNSQLVAEYVSTVPLPYLDKLQSNEKWANKDALLLKDNCSIHVRREILPILVISRECIGCSTQPWASRDWPYMMQFYWREGIV
jgi:hypothetical protein